MMTFNSILFRIYANPLMRNVRKVDVLSYVMGFLNMTKLHTAFVEKSIVLDIKDYRAPLPKDFKRVVSVNRVYNSSNTPGTKLKKSTDDRIEHNRNQESRTPSTVTYKVVPGYIYMDAKSMRIEVVYQAYSVDENGFPLLPDSESLLNAIEGYVKVKYFTILVETGHLPGAALDRAEQQYSWYVGQAFSEVEMPDEDGAESMIDALARLIPDRDAFFTNFKYNSNTEKLKLHD